MLEEWMCLDQYKLLRTSDTSEASIPWTVHCTHWFGLRRVRTAIAIAGLFLVAVTLVRFYDLPSGLQNSQQENGLSLQDAHSVNWTEFAYVQYVTNPNYLCNSLMILEALHRSGTKADRIMLHPEDWQVQDELHAEMGTESKLLAQARDQYGTKLVPVKIQTIARGDATWKDSFTKLLAFNQTQYTRLISLDSDATVQQHMDELFLLPPAPVAMPRAYWLDQPFLSSQLIVLQPSKLEWQRIEEFMSHENAGFDMDILNTIYKDSCIMIPHRRYNILSAEFRAEDHTKYLGSSEAWDGHKALKDAKFIHFSDWPVPKPWLKAADSVIDTHQPKCKDIGDGKEDCTDRDIWLRLYRDFSERRQRVCGRSHDQQRRTSRSQVLQSPVPPKAEPVPV